MIVYNLSGNSKVLINIIMFYSLLRVFEIIIYQLNVLLFHPYRSKLQGKEYKVNSITRMVVALLQNYIEIMFWYSTLIISLVVLNKNTAYDLTWIRYIEANIMCITTFDSNRIENVINQSYSYVAHLIFIEIISGIIMTLLSLARFVGILPEVKEQG